MIRLYNHRWMNKAAMGGGVAYRMVYVLVKVCNLARTSVAHPADYGSRITHVRPHNWLEHIG